MTNAAGLERVHRVVYIRTDRLGDALLNLPAIAALKASLPSVSVALVVDPALVELMTLVPAVDEVLEDQPGGPWWTGALRLAGRLRQGRFDLAIVSNPKKASHVAVWLAGIRWRVGYDRKWAFLLTHRIRDRKALGERHEVQYNFDLLQAIGIPTTMPSAWRLSVSEQADRQAAGLLHSAGWQPPRPLVVVHPWTSNPAKQWPIERYRELMERLGRDGSIGVAVAGAAHERSQLGAVLPSGVQVIDLVGRLTLTGLAAVLHQASVTVSNDSGPAHLASAVGTRAVVIFGTANPAAGPTRWGPWGEEHLVIARPSLDQITVDEVLEKTVEAVRRSRQGVRC